MEARLTARDMARVQYVLDLLGYTAMWKGFGYGEDVWVIEPKDVKIGASEEVVNLYEQQLKSLEASE